MDIKQLSIFAAVAEHASFTKAAIALDFSQSHVTTQVRRLEQQIGTMLFDRRGRGVHLTGSGRTLLAYARRMDALVREAEAAVSAKAARGVLSVAAHETLAIYWLPELMVRLRESVPDIDVRLTMIEDARISRAVHDGSVDVALVYALATAPQASNAIVLIEEGPTLVCSPDLSPARTGRLGASDMREFDALVPMRPCPNRTSFDRMLEVAGVPNARLREFSSVETMKQYALRGLGYALLPRIAVAEEIRDGALVELAPPAQLENVAATVVFSSAKTAELDAFVDVTRAVYAA